MTKQKTALIQNDRIEIEFEFDLDIISSIRNIDGRVWLPKFAIWTLPLSPWHCAKVVEALTPFGFYIDPNITLYKQFLLKPAGKAPKGLYPFQVETYNFIASRGGRCIVADEMGLGKTISTLAYIGKYCGKALVVAPASVLYKWHEECVKWVPNRKAQVLDSGKVEIEVDADIHITSYTLMANRYEELNKLPYDVIILDECHYIKDQKSKRSRVARALVRNGIPKLIGLSGTPFMNRPGELFTMLNAIDPVAFKSFYTFASRYMGATYLMGHWYFPPGQVTNAEELSERLSMYMVRHTKREVLTQLPDLTRTIIPVEIKNRGRYKEAVRDIRTWLKSKDKDVLNPAHVLTRLNVLRQIVGEGKVEDAVELAEGVLQEGKKVVLFAHHRDVVDGLSSRLESHGVRRIVGDVPAKERQESSNLFLIPDSGINVMIISTAGNVGIDLYGASDIIFVEREWVPAQEEQAEARLHRIGQKNAVSAYYLYASRTVDEKLARLIQKKRDMFGKVVRQDEILETVLEEIGG